MYSDKKKQLIKDINSLGERFPVVYVSNLTGYAKSNVSEYYNGEKEPSEQFLNKFYKEFHKLKKPTDSGIDNMVMEERPSYGFSEKLIDLLQKQQETINRSSITILEQAQTISQLLGNSSAPAVNGVR